MLIVEPVPAASVIILREPFEVLMIQRHPKSSFVPGVWVFPGGAVDPGDGQPGSLEAARNAAVREVLEETSIRLTDPPVPTSRWITPAGLPKRFDTWFFLALAPPGVTVTLQAAEAVASLWISPLEALGRGATFPLVLPTIKNLEAIAGHHSIEELLASRRGAVIQPVEPILVDHRPVLR